MHIAVVIPFRGDAGVLQWTLEGLARQELPEGATLEVRLCGDGVGLPAMPGGAADSAFEGRIRFTGVEAPRVGVAEAKNLLLRGQPADVVIFVNADTQPVPQFVAAHVRRLLSLPPGHLVLGSAPYESSAANVFDALKSDSPMIFFYHQLVPHGLHDFRHGWTLNLSARYVDLERIDFFDSRFRPYGNEDLDMAFRLMGPEAKAIYYEPTAQVLHRHPMTFDDYLNREELLGIMAPVLHDNNPALFHRLLGPASLESLTGQYRNWLELDRASHPWIYKRMQEWNVLPARSLGEGPERDRLLMTLYQMHIPLKRMAFRMGFLRGLELRDDALWQQRIPAGLWRALVSRP